MKKLFLLGVTLLAARANASGECKAIPGAAGLLNHGATILVGGVNGTKEIPQAFGELVCLATHKQIPMLIGLELPAPELSSVEKFLNTGDRAELMKAPPFKRPRQDGRASLATVELLERLRALRSAGAHFRLVLFDAQPGDASLRPTLMSRAIASARAPSKSDLLLVLMDEKEAAIGDNTTAGKLKQSQIAFTSLRAAHAGGTAWNCDKDCGERPVAGKAAGKAPSVQLDPKLEAYNGTLNVGPISASPPAAAASH